ncbi:ATPase vacuolar ER assembly factor Vma12 protein [Rutstroemia sp. NJR-2017a BVV2]|nr:ATPase vacuolar ER assembly factor Vma12 protein [Rutstroemia sp. NJR-2017a BVV2]
MRISYVYLGKTRPLSEASSTGGATFNDKLVIMITFIGSHHSFNHFEINNPSIVTMVCLTMTSTMVEGLIKLQSFQVPVPEAENTRRETNNNTTTEGEQSEQPEEAQERDGFKSEQIELPAVCKDDGGSINKLASEPSLADPKIGNPISHGQVLDIWRNWKSHDESCPSLETLLQGSRVYIPPPPPKPEPSAEYKALMAKLRREEEARAYERMMNPPPPMETFAQKYPTSSAAHAFAANFPDDKSSEEDEVTYADIDRQIAVIFNVIVSIVACAAGIWMAAAWWSTPARLALSMSGSLLVGVAEVVVYAGYIRRVGEAKGKEKKLQEVKEIVRTWVVGANETEEQEPLVTIGEKEDSEEMKPRRRNI